MKKGFKMILLFTVVSLFLICCVSEILFKYFTINGHYIVGLTWLILGMSNGLSITVYLNYMRI